MSVLSLICVLSLLPAVICLRCHQVANGRLADPITSTAMDCPMNSYSCVKMVDATAGTYLKQCSYTNCTLPSDFQNHAAYCYNNSVIGRESYSCCCYGDGCNSAPSMSMTFIVLLSVVALYTKMSQ